MWYTEIKFKKRKKENILDNQKITKPYIINSIYQLKVKNNNGYSLNIIDIWGQLTTIVEEVLYTNKRNRQCLQPGNL